MKEGKKFVRKKERKKLKVSFLPFKFDIARTLVVNKIGTFFIPPAIKVTVAALDRIKGIVRTKNEGINSLP